MCTYQDKTKGSKYGHYDTTRLPKGQGVQLHEWLRSAQGE